MPMLDDPLSEEVFLSISIRQMHDKVADLLLLGGSGPTQREKYGFSGSDWVREDSGSSTFPPVYSICCLPHEVVKSFKALHLALSAKKSLSN